MKLLTIKLVFTLAFLSLSSLSLAQTNFQIGGGLVLSPDYSDRIDELYPNYETTGGFGWIKLDLDILYGVTDQVDLNTRLSFAANFVHVDEGPQEESYFNTIFLPGIGIRYHLNSAYVYALANFPLPSTGSDFIEFENDGAGFEIGIGSSIGKKSYIEAAYLDAPFKMNDEKGNFGGGVALSIGFKI